jgi:septum formation protein
VRLKRIVLASASPRRAELLKMLGVDFEVCVPDIDETIESSAVPEEAVASLSRRKAIDVGRNLSHKAIIIAADTIVLKERILGKPENSYEAFGMLKLLQGQWHTVITGFTVIDMYQDASCVSGFEKTNVKMRDMPPELIRAYLETGEPFDKAGAYGIQGYGALLVERIEGCYFNVMGLPVMRIGRVLEELGVNLLAHVKK